jgi:hypothetical protein
MLKEHIIREIILALKVILLIGIYLFFFLSFLVGLGFDLSFELAKQALYCLSHTCSPFRSDYFGDEVSSTICLGWPPTLILLISASEITRIKHMSHWCHCFFFTQGLICSPGWPQIH